MKGGELQGVGDGAGVGDEEASIEREGATGLDEQLVEQFARGVASGDEEFGEVARDLLVQREGLGITLIGDEYVRVPSRVPPLNHDWELVLEGQA